ncbi:pyridoxal 5'-phosphate synthase lyase subunit PdxS [Halosegnis rubeus]|jgi:pyridoxal 5'-phosphate synthase pdxS subunit|uniref:Pyridoxal 5'-phosphate synthase subunit PdxS n=1 Tax=Halosegnis rubeus TaxID=2212850 RepID=A0A5N5UBD6_9EURY|nr:pyridoxal 5'-phosphate synthase lyase subunit PdxS [Halosegnis rubeus]KAB7515649.1 pyridoxal 5'-phosphate synthase lyase subunit PdxS [Halosegnis rubeus]KAB7517146.1 pyridoxal 5'-phosphate synthase lyase subunit PdxS [Halosegnis rubeus]KAB7519735.1 pyridoxal 5'-phosphate synthase lyase subunit PdxS [Halosegnis rubeus]
MSETDIEELRRGTDLVKRGFAKMQKGGVIMDVVSREQARIAEDAGAVAVMHLESVPADIRKRGGVARMADPGKLEEVIDEVSIPTMGKCRIGHTAEAQILEAAGADMLDESEVLTQADDRYHIDKRDFTAPFVCGARNLGEALRRIDEGAAMIRTKGEAGTGDVNQAVTHQRNIQRAIRKLSGMNYEERDEWAREHEAPRHLVHETADRGRLPVVNFAAGGIATPADAALMMHHGCDGIFVGSGIFGAENPEAMGEAIVAAVNNYDDPETLKEIAKSPGKGMSGQANALLDEDEKLQGRGV